ncbi:MAG: 2-C-methyl-D-erythritol 2,4-cyclodiphosphate synthase [Oscillospiraceae bacterium]|nr:2-C-methyl-D-erythritol 2,4-cyclodiphosphate synthase [Oscillospiraceae bacterium]
MMSCEYKIGHGYDAHRLIGGRKCVLCGVEIPCPFGPDGHSDADVPIHALMDALLGACALGDIGEHYPPSERAWKDISSMELLAKTYALILSHGYCVGNVDITIVLEAPRLSEYIRQMRENIAAVLKTDVGTISVKATTEEGMGFTGSGMGVCATAVVCLRKI